MITDPILLEVIRSRIMEAASTMEHQLFHSGYSPILRESADGSASILDRHGHVIAGTGFPIHLFPYFHIGRTILELHGARMAPGDSFLLNDPYLSGNFHVPDTAIVSPFFHGDELAGFCASIAHKPDLGGSIPGSCSSTARDIYQEGIVFPGVRYYCADGVVTDIEAILRRNSRAPDEVAGDLLAQVGCTRIGIERITEIFDKYGGDTVFDAFDALIKRSERILRAGIAQWPDGEAEAEAFLDHAAAPNRSIRLHVRLRKAGERMTIDFSGSDAQIAAPINLRPQAAETAAVLAIAAFVDPAIPINDGCRRPLEFINPAGRITHAMRPAPVNNYYGTMHLLNCCVQQALAHFAPAGAVAPAGLGWGGCSVGYAKARSGEAGVQYEVVPPSLGGTSKGDGAFQVQPMSHITPCQPIEILETEYPLEVLRFEPIIDSAGAGLFRGGPGYLRAYRFLDNAQFNLKMMPFPHGAWGVLGGGPSNRHGYVLNPGTSTEEMLPPLATREVKSGDEVWMTLPGGGGYGNPLARDVASVARDIRDGLVSEDAARSRYGVHFQPSTEQGVELSGNDDDAHVMLGGQRRKVSRG